MSSYFWRGHGLNLVSQSNQAQQKQFRVGAAGMGASTLGGRGHAPPENFEIQLLQNALFAHSLKELTKK